MTCGVWAIINPVLHMEAQIGIFFAQGQISKWRNQNLDWDNLLSEYKFLTTMFACD